jgi:hypothetical protein
MHLISANSCLERAYLQLARHDDPAGRIPGALREAFFVTPCQGGAISAAPTVKLDLGGSSRELVHGPLEVVLVGHGVHEQDLVGEQGGQGADPDAWALHGQHALPQGCTPIPWGHLHAAAGSGMG